VISYRSFTRLRDPLIYAIIIQNTSTVQARVGDEIGGRVAGLDIGARNIQSPCRSKCIVILPPQIMMGKWHLVFAAGFCGLQNAFGHKAREVGSMNFSETI